jgi:hypothetical protein
LVQVLDQKMIGIQIQFGSGQAPITMSALPEDEVWWQVMTSDPILAKILLLVLERPYNDQEFEPACCKPKHIEAFSAL